MATMTPPISIRDIRLMKPSGEPVDTRGATGRLMIATPALSQPNVQQINEPVKACVEAVNAGGGFQSDAYYNPALQGVHIGVATPMWTFKFDKCMAERGFALGS
jgi:hypothetical protein